jgi:hypothetical protein
LGKNTGYSYPQASYPQVKAPNLIQPYTTRDFWEEKAETLYNLNQDNPLPPGTFPK